MHGQLVWELREGGCRGTDIRFIAAEYIKENRAQIDSMYAVRSSVSYAAVINCSDPDFYSTITESSVDRQ